MIKIITALGNPFLNEELKKEENFEILGQDILYQEGIFEKIENIKKLDFIILSELLPGENDLIELITKIKEINNEINFIIILIEQKEEIKNKLIEKGIFNIFYNNKITKEEIIKIINKKNNNSEEEIKEEIKLLKNMILEKNKNESKNSFKKYFNNLKNNLINNKSLNKKIIKIENKNNIIISITGAPGIGKTIITYLLCNKIKNKKILVFDNSDNNIFKLLFNIKKYYNKKIENNNINRSILKINKKIDLIFFKEIINEIEINNYLNIIKNKYDLIFFDINLFSEKEINKNILKDSDKIFFLSGTNLIEIKKSQELLKEYIKEFKIKKEKINIIFNKYNKSSIDTKLLNEMFYKFKILGKINYDDLINLIINKNKFKLNKKINNQINEILNNIFYKKIKLLKIHNKYFNKIKNN